MTSGDRGSEAAASFMSSPSSDPSSPPSLVELNGKAVAPEVGVLESAVGLDCGSPDRLEVRVVGGGVTVRGGEPQAQVRKRLERRHDRVGRERPLVREETGDEDARVDVPLERGEARGRAG